MEGRRGCIDVPLNNEDDPEPGEVDFDYGEDSCPEYNRVLHAKGDFIFGV